MFQQMEASGFKYVSDLEEEIMESVYCKQRHVIFIDGILTVTEKANNHE